MTTDQGSYLRLKPADRKKKETPVQTQALAPPMLHRMNRVAYTEGKKPVGRQGRPNNHLPHPTQYTSTIQTRPFTYLPITHPQSNYNRHSVVLDTALSRQECQTKARG